MRARQFMMTAMVLTMGWSTNVAYEFQTGTSLGKSFLRSIASESEEITIENVISHVETMEARVKSIIELKQSIESNIKAEEKDLGTLMDNRANELADVKGMLDKYRNEKKALEDFLKDKDGQIVEESNTRLQAMKDSLKEHDFMKLSVDLSFAIDEAVAETTRKQEAVMKELRSNICESNKELADISTKLDKLLEDPKKVVAKVEETKDSQKVDPMAFFSAAMAAMTAQSQSFFSAPQYTGLASDANPFGLDMNFLMMSKMLTGSNGFGPRASINYAPVYNQQRTFYGMPQMFNLDEGAQFRNNSGLQFNQDPMMNRSLPNGVFPGFNFNRGNGLSSEIQLPQVNPTVAI